MAIGHVMNTLIKKAIQHAGSQKRLAQACGVSQPAVNKWLHGGNITPRNAISIERATEGQIPKSELCPEIWEDDKAVA